MSAPLISLVVAMDEDGVIGREGGLPWRMSSDLRWFKEVTLGKPVVMGRKTYESIGRPLPGRPNVVMTRDEGFAAEGVTVARSLDEALAAARRLAGDAGDTGAEEVCVIGGGAVYAEALPRADRIYLTRIEAQVDGDTRFPPLERGHWNVVLLRRIEPGPKDDHPARIERWDRR